MAPVEHKVQASTAAAATSGLVLWIIGRYLFKGDVPDVVASWVYVAVPAIVTFAAGYLTKHTPRSVMPPSRPAKTLLPPAAARGADISPLADPPMEDLPAPVIPPAAPE